MIDTESKARRLLIPVIDGLGTIKAYMGNTTPEAGWIRIECCSLSWSASWSAMGGPVESFFVSCSNDYLAGCLSREPARLLNADLAVVRRWMKAEILKARRSDQLSEAKARLYWMQADWLVVSSSHCSNETMLVDVVGDCWWLSMPTKPNPAHVHLCRVIDAVKEGLRQRMAEEE